ncbi:MAG: peptidoglycan editing factor PgeF [Betaproteobacteria bacterium]
MSVDAELASRSLDWIIPEWPVPTSVRALFTTRNGGFSTGVCRSMNLGPPRGDDPVHVAQNRQLLRDVCGVEPFYLSQTHGTAVVAIDSAPQLSEGDAAFATQPGLAAIIRVADCLPVLFCDRAGTRVAAAHAGWRGLCAGVLEATVTAMNIAPEQIIAWLGPAIGPSAFEVGDEVRAAFVAREVAAAEAFVPYPGRHGKWLADLYALARMRLRAVGVNQIHGGGFCTLTDAQRFFSYRRDKTTGRMAALIWLEPHA